MCVAMYIPQGKLVDRDDMALAHAENSDGCGFAVWLEAGLLVRKGLWSFETFWRAYKPYAGLEALLHFRWASAGKIDKDNCHPFVVQPDLALVHNGHIHGYGTSTQSDTRQWVELTLKPLLARYPDALREPVLRRVLEDSLAGSKVALLGKDGPVILNEHAGKWEHGVWYSQTGYRRPVRRVEPAGSVYSQQWGEIASWGKSVLRRSEADECVCCGSYGAEYAICGACLSLEDADTADMWEEQ